MAGNQLKDALTKVDWSKNVSSFILKDDILDRIEKRNLRIAVWSKQIEMADAGNPALAFVREMQVSGHFVPVLIGLGLYRPAAASMRSMVESALYYTYFRSHPKELATLTRKPDYYISKSDILDYHKIHTPRWSEHQSKIDLIGMLNNWYSTISAIVHGQVPGTWSANSSILNVKASPETEDAAVLKFEEGEEIIHRLLLFTFGSEKWGQLSTTGKKAILKGMPGEIKEHFKFDGA